MYCYFITNYEVFQVLYVLLCFLMIYDFTIVRVALFEVLNPCIPDVPMIVALDNLLQQYPLVVI